MTFKVYAKEELGYDTMTTYWEDFSIAERFGKSAIIDTYQRAMKEHKNDYKILTEIVLILNHKIWHHYNNHNEPLADLYNELWQKADAWCCENLKGDELTYFYRVLD